jgi:hypothetical protein
MPNIRVYSINAEVPSRGGVGTVSEIVIPENINRVGLVVTNIADQTIYLGIGNTATLKAGIVLTPAGGAWSMDEYTYSKQAITAIADTSTLVIAFQEFTTN